METSNTKSQLQFPKKSNKHIPNPLGGRVQLRGYAGGRIRRQPLPHPTRVSTHVGPTVSHVRAPHVATAGRTWPSGPPSPNYKSSHSTALKLPNPQNETRPRF